MGLKMSDKIIAAIDIGTTKICVLVAKKDFNDQLDLIGIGQSNSYGLKKGVIVDVNKTVDSIKKAVAQAQEMSGIVIDTACVGISGGHIKSFNSSGVVAVKNKNITQSDVNKVIEAAKAVAIPQDQEILHVLPQYFKVDGQDNILDSVGMHGVRLEAQVHIITGAVTSAQNIIQACNLASINASDIVLEQIASANAVLTSSESELGAGILDIGGGTADFAIYKDGRIIHSKVIPLAGNHFTNDLAIAFNISKDQAEQIKKNYGFVWEEKYLEIDKDKINIFLEHQNIEKAIDIYTLFEVLNFRAQEIVDILTDELIKFRLMSFMPSGLVLTGGGSLLSGMKELFEKSLKLPVRIGYPNGYKESALTKNFNVPDILKSPIYATGYGLLLYAAGLNNQDAKLIQKNGTVAEVFKKMRSWLYEFL
ncbi:cell division protein FtsA [Candidatus Babeliales bacterium]|nr:cell division protein FtsA [Candidatus Babeliales bacterium]MCF7899517.1 cell division protein FtsA [Candidatus Babeliales bacterium]